MSARTSVMEETRPVSHDTDAGRDVPARDELLRLYMSEAAGTPLLTAEEEVTLARAVGAGAAASERLTSATVEQVELAQSAAREPLSLDLELGEDGDTLGELVADEDLLSTEEAAERADMRSAVIAALDTLEPAQSAVLRLRFGLEGGRPHTLRE